MNLAASTLANTSITASKLWTQLEQTQTPEEVEQLLTQLWQNQDNQELAVDAHADLVDQIEAEILAIQARMEHLVTLHQAAIQKLQSWRTRLDATVLRLNESGILHNEVVGKQRRILVKNNPPTCDILVKPEQLPTEYQRVQTKTLISANKKAITAAWKQGIPVQGTHVYHQRKVMYSLLK